MSVKFQSFIGNPKFQSFGGGKFEARSGGVNLVFVATVNFNEPGDKINFVGHIDNSEFAKIGINSTAIAGVTDLFAYKDVLYQCGFYGNGDPLSGISRLNSSTGVWGPVSGTDLRTFGTGTGTGREMCTYKDDLIIVGVFNNANGLDDTIGIVAFDGNEYYAIGGTSTEAMSGSSKCIQYRDSLYVSGFSPKPPNFINVKSWDGSSWSLLPSPEPFQNGVLGFEVYNDLLHILAEGKIVTWDESSYSTFATFEWSAGQDARPNAAVIYKGDLVVAGSFYRVDGVSGYGGAARFDGTSWSPMGSISTAIGKQAFDLHVSDGVLYACGDFTTNAHSEDIQKIAMWNEAGSKWEPAGNRDEVVSITECNSIYDFKGNLKGGQ